MRQPLTAYGLVLVVLRMIGVAYLAWWAFEWSKDIHYLVFTCNKYGWDQFHKVWTHAVPRPLRDLSLSSLPINLEVARFALAIYFTFGGRHLARFIARGTEPAGCPKCGYPLVGLQGDRCPECGEQFTPKPPPTAASPTTNP